jgi:flagellar biosynthetic protein FliQ
MTPADVIEVGRDALIVLLKIGAPVLLVALVVGLAISLVQALTQIQEMTLAFVPKIVVIFLALMFFMPFMLTTLTTFTQHLFDKIVALG